MWRFHRSGLAAASSWYRKPVVPGGRVGGPWRGSGLAGNTCSVVTSVHQPPSCACGCDFVVGSCEHWWVVVVVWLLLWRRWSFWVCGVSPTCWFRSLVCVGCGLSSRGCMCLFRISAQSVVSVWAFPCGLLGLLGGHLLGGFVGVGLRVVRDVA